MYTNAIHRVYCLNLSDLSELYEVVILVKWVIAQHACSAYSYVYVPLYDTLGPEAMQHILNQIILFRKVALDLGFAVVRVHQ
ncbi:hypothetical protein AHF37_07114 [Paragonimus kellicotti]|nr:hypothetical protein AHF37_07114 [Paragonimus kellicotti]